jgi:hypothetical protein
MRAQAAWSKGRARNTSGARIPSPAESAHASPNGTPTEISPYARARRGPSPIQVNRPSEALTGPLPLVEAHEDPLDDEDQPDEERGGEQELAHSMTVEGPRGRCTERSECFSPVETGAAAVGHTTLAGLARLQEDLQQRNDSADQQARDRRERDPAGREPTSNSGPSG